MTDRPDDAARDVRDLLARFAAGESAAQDEVLARYGPHITRLARRHLGHRLRRRLDTLDAVQESMVEIYRRAVGKVFTSEAEFLAWMRLVVKHRMISILRRIEGRGATRVPTGRIGESAEVEDARAPRPSERLVRREMRERIFIATQSLSRIDQEIILLRVFLDTPWKTMSEALGATEAALQMRFGRAKKALERSLREREEGPDQRLDN